MRKFIRYPSSYVKANFVQLPHHSTSQELGMLLDSLNEFLDEFSGWNTSDVDTQVDIPAIQEQLEDLAWDIEKTRKRLDAAHYLATIPFVKRGSKINPDNATKLAKAKAALSKVGMYFKDEEMPVIMDYYNKYFKTSYNAYTQFDEA